MVPERLRYPRCGPVRDGPGKEREDAGAGGSARPADLRGCRGSRLRRGGIAVRQPGRSAGHVVRQRERSRGTGRRIRAGSRRDCRPGSAGNRRAAERGAYARGAHAGQQGLSALGFDAGPADGMFGPRNRSAIWEWQQAKGLETTGYLSRDEAEVLAAAGADSQEAAEPAGQGNQVLCFMPEGPKCAELGCYIWTDSYPSYRIENWTGGCAGHTAHGQGSPVLGQQQVR